MLTPLHFPGVIPDNEELVKENGRLSVSTQRHLPFQMWNENKIFASKGNVMGGCASVVHTWDDGSSAEHKLSWRRRLAIPAKTNLPTALQGKQEDQFQAVLIIALLVGFFQDSINPDAFAMPLSLPP